MRNDISVYKPCPVNSIQNCKPYDLMSAGRFYRPQWLNISTKRVGGIRFLKLGRFCFSFCLTNSYKGF
jgi:hypothetical protein